MARKGKTSRPSVRVRDLKPKKNPKGGASDIFAKLGDIKGESLTTTSPTVSTSINFTTLNIKK